MSNPLSKSELVHKVRSAREIESSFRIYVREWTVVGRCPTKEQAEQELSQQYGGRLRAEDIQTVQDFDETWVKTVRRWNMSAEVKGEELAAEFYQAILDSGYEAQLVERNSRAEHTLAQYGVTLLPRS